MFCQFSIWTSKGFSSNCSKVPRNSKCGSFISFTSIASNSLALSRYSSPSALLTIFIASEFVLLQIIDVGGSWIVIKSVKHRNGDFLVIYERSKSVSPFMVASLVASSMASISFRTNSPTVALVPSCCPIGVEIVCKDI